MNYRIKAHIPPSIEWKVVSYHRWMWLAKLEAWRLTHCNSLAGVIIEVKN
jgi:hypothetical protein